MDKVHKKEPSEDEGQGECPIQERRNARVEKYSSH